MCADLLARGLQVRALVRNPASAHNLASQGVDIIAGDLQDPHALQALVAGSAAVVHAAGVVRGRSQADFDRVNVAGTRAVLAAVQSQPTPPRLLLLSSLAAREPGLSWYAHSKHAGEQLLAAATALDWVILRPPAVYGPGDREMLPLFRLMARGIATVPGLATARLSLVHVADLTAAIHAALDAPASRHQTYYPSDGKAGGYDWHELAALVEATWGRRVRIWQVPAWLLDTVARTNLGLAALTGGAPMLTPAKLRELRHPDWVVDHSELTAATGWQPAVGLAAGLAELRKAEL